MPFFCCSGWWCRMYVFHSYNFQFLNFMFHSHDKFQIQDQKYFKRTLSVEILNLFFYFFSLYCLVNALPFIPWSILLKLEIIFLLVTKENGTNLLGESTRYIAPSLRYRLLLQEYFILHPPSPNFRRINWHLHPTTGIV